MTTSSTRSNTASASRLLLALAGLPACAHAPPSPTPDLVAETERIVRAFIAAARAEGVAVAEVPGVRVETTPNLIFYAAGAVTVPRWSDLGPEVQGLFSAWASAADTAYDGEAMFEDLFHWFLIPHELSHYLDEIRGVEAGHYAAEQRANRVAVGFWGRDPADGERLARFCETSVRLCRILPDPVPAGEDRGAWFDLHYEVLAQDPVAYGQFQFQFMATACGERELHTFGELLTTP